METNKLNRLKVVLSERGVKQTWLAEKLGTSKVVVNLWCSNRSQPSLSKLHEIAEILNINVRLLIESNCECEEIKL